MFGCVGRSWSLCVRVCFGANFFWDQCFLNGFDVFFWRKKTLFCKKTTPLSVSSKSKTQSPQQDSRISHLNSLLQVAGGSVQQELLKTCCRNGKSCKLLFVKKDRSFRVPKCHKILIPKSAFDQSKRSLDSQLLINRLLRFLLGDHGWGKKTKKSSPKMVVSFFCDESHGIESVKKDHLN